MGEFPNTETQFKKGEGGRPKGARNRSTIIKQIVEAAANQMLRDLAKSSGHDPVALGLGEDTTIFDHLVGVQVLKAMKGDTAAFKEIADGGFGKVTDKVQQTVQYKKMGKIIVEPVAADPSKPDSAPSAYELTFDVGEDPLIASEEEEEDTEE